MIRTLYKAYPPFMKVKDGIGYYGVVRWDDNEDKVQCHICGLWYENVGSHTQRKHKVFADDYKQRFGLTLRTALCGRGLSQRRMESTKKAIANGLIKQDIAQKAAKYNKTKKRFFRQVGVKTHQYFNKSGLCDMQIRYRYDVVKNIVGHDPSQNELMKYDRKLFYCGIVPRYGNLNTYREMIGAKKISRYAPNKVPSIEMISALRKFQHENGRAPKTTDFNGLLKSFYREFGSWSNALRTAGIK